jgi:hypothetical protein
MPWADRVNFRRLREGGCRRLGRRGASGQCIRAFANDGKLRRRRLRPLGNRLGGTLEPADHCPEFKLKQFENFRGRIASGCRRSRRFRHLRLDSRRLDGRHNDFRHALSK